jgi:hypothetical protein
VKKCGAVVTSLAWLFTTGSAQAATNCNDLNARAVHALFAGLPGRLPEDVSKFICRRALCNHWAGEEPYDAARAHQITAAVNRLKCEALVRDENDLRRYYGLQPDVLGALELTKDRNF